MTFKDILAADLAVFINSDEFGETVTYTPYGGTGASVSAVVIREEYTKDYIGSEIHLMKRGSQRLTRTATPLLLTALCGRLNLITRSARTRLTGSL